MRTRESQNVELPTTEWVRNTPPRNLPPLVRASAERLHCLRGFPLRRCPAMSAAGGGSDAEDLYAVLGVGRDATDADIRRAYHALAQALHPDKHVSSALREVCVVPR